MRSTRLIFKCIILASLIGGLFLTVAIWSFSPVSAKWQPRAQIPTARFEALTAVVGERLYIISGFFNKNLQTTTQVHSYDPLTDSWKAHQDIPIGLTHANAAVDGKKIWIAGGFQGQNPGTAIAEVRFYDTESDEWGEGPALPAARGGGGLVRFGRELHYIGGYVAPIQESAEDAHWVLNLDGGTKWEARAPLPVARGHCAVASVGDKIYIIGGATTHHPFPFDTALVSEYTPATNSWRETTPLPSPRSHFEPGSFVHGGRIYIISGRDNMSEHFSEMEMTDITVFDPVEQSWTDVPGLPQRLRAVNAEVIGDQLIVTAGSTFWAEQPQQNTFQTLCDDSVHSICQHPSKTSRIARWQGKTRAALKRYIGLVPLRLQEVLQLQKLTDD